MVAPARLLFASLLLAGLASAARLSAKEYERKAEDYKRDHSKDDFISKLSEGDEKVSLHRGERAWTYFQEQLEGGRVVFGDSNVQFMLPPTHAFSRVTDVIHTGIADAVEFVFQMGRQLYFGSVKQLPHHVQSKHDDFFHWLFESKLVRYALYGFVGFFAINMVIRRFTCGLPDDIKKYAAIYEEKKAKKQL